MCAWPTGPPAASDVSRGRALALCDDEADERGEGQGEVQCVRDAELMEERQHRIARAGAEQLTIRPVVGLGGDARQHAGRAARRPPRVATARGETAASRAA